MQDKVLLVLKQEQKLLVAAHPKIKELRYEAALFSGWEQAKADAALEALPQQWEAFSSQLTEWKNKNL